MYFGPTHIPRLSIGYRNEVEVDAAGKIHILDGLDVYRKTCREPTWNAVMHYAEDLRNRGVKMAFFSSTPQGGGVALVRGAMFGWFWLTFWADASCVDPVPYYCWRRLQVVRQIWLLMVFN